MNRLAHHLVNPSRQLSWLRHPRPTTVRTSRRILLNKNKTLPTVNDYLPAVPIGQVLTSASPAASFLKGPQLAITRKLELLNVVIGVDQANQYTILNDLGSSVGYIIEEDTFAKSIMRNILHTHRPMHASVLDLNGNRVLEIHRPFNFINSVITVKCAQSKTEIGVVEQEWHLWRRRYNLFNSKSQFARIDAPILSWDFPLCTESGTQLGLIDRNFTGIGRELFTDTGHYAVHYNSPVGSSELSLDERAVVLAAAVTIDFDYFTRDRGGFMPMVWIPGVWGGNDE